MLADYVLALLRHDGDINTVRALCEAEIPDFLKEDSAVFVQDVFDAITYKTYAGGVIPARRSSGQFAPPTGPSAPLYPLLGVSGAPTGPQNGSRKRSYNDRGDGDSQDRGYIGGTDPNGRSYKQPRRGGNVGRGNYDSFGNSRGGFQGRPQSMNVPGLPPFQNEPGMPSPPPGMPPIDPNNPVAAIMAMQAMGFPIPGMPNFPGGSPQNGSPAQRQPRKQRCRDYDSKGICSRGDTCIFEHGRNPIYVPPTGKGDEYDPSNSSLMTGIEKNNGSPGGFNNFRGNDRGRGRGGQRGDRGGQFNNPGRRGGRAEFSSDRPNYDRTKTTIVVENIPEEKFSEDEVRLFFSEFGNIVEISMRPYKRLAIVKYEDYSSAKDAYNSPKVIFDNRFVKVYWFVDQESLPQLPASSTAKRMDGSLSNGSSTPAPARATSEPKIDIEEFALKQQEVQKAHEEKMKKKQEMEAARKELERRQEELLKNQAEEKRKLMEKIAAMSGKPASPAGGSEPGTPTAAETKVTSQTDILKAQLAALQAEAQSLGLDPSLSDDFGAGRGRGRGRGGYRGRGAFVPRGARGGYRGRGGAPFAGGVSAYKLDNRPKTIGLKGIDFTVSTNWEALGTYLLVSP